jgi:hypothetical protein
MPRDDPDEELVALLSDLERTLTELQATIGPDADRRRPPTPGEILRFTEQYTLPTAIALLEATVRSLELLRALLRLADPKREGSSGGTTDRRADTPDLADVRSAFADLQTALARPDPPTDSEAGSILAEARDLTAEIEEHLAESGGSRRDGSADAAGIGIDVTTEGEDDVDAELESIKESVREDEEE